MWKLFTIKIEFFVNESRLLFDLFMWWFSWYVCVCIWHKSNLEKESPLFLLLVSLSAFYLTFFLYVSWRKSKRYYYILFFFWGWVGGWQCCAKIELNAIYFIQLKFVDIQILLKGNLSFGCCHPLYDLYY